MAPTEQAARERTVSSEPLEYASSEEVPAGCVEDVSVQICTALEVLTARIVKREIKRELKEMKRSVRGERKERRWEMKEVKRQVGRDFKELRRGVKREMKELRKEMRAGLKMAKSSQSHVTVEESA